MREIAAKSFPRFRDDQAISDNLKDFIHECMVFDPNERLTADQFLSHPFIKKCDNLNREEIYKELLAKQIDYTDLISDEDIEYAKKIISCEITPEFNEEKNKYDDKKTLKTFITQPDPGSAVDTTYTKESNAP